ncbi:uncharacterized protein LOC107610459 [Arachis ipaensis]|uniref:uncharacterized protein LOC107610459 n=1 Tax=Arachis ipaensis TaxID=130454 RepID=UPI0007AF18E8|nr:uncharacterized protein LOC107610459 [Arachis ipaensis]XP_025669814.1 uncharacterized protein LOC112769520 [Arachis hypogaea]
MANQTAELTNARIKNNGDHNERVEEEEHESDLTHVSKTPRHEEARPKNEDDEPDNTVGPFTADIMNFQMPRIFTLPTTLTPYDGLGDLKKHVKKFRSLMIVNSASDPIYADYFTASSIYLHNSDYLNKIKQGQNESLKDYITRFTKVAMTVPDLHPEVHLHAIKSGLRPGKFQEAITVAKPKSLAEFHEKAKGQMKIEELQQARKSDKPHSNKDEDKARDSKKTFKLTHRYDSYTQFNTKRDDIIKEILNSNLIKPPRKAGSYSDAKNADKSKYCIFHQKHGHTTNECVNAKDLLERLARQGHLDKYINGTIQKRDTSSADHTSTGQHSRDKEKTTHSYPNQPWEIINYISGGFAGEGATSSARKCTYQAMFSVEGTGNDVSGL